MKYFKTTFNICSPAAELWQPCRELLADACGECGYESFEDTDEGLDGYVRQDMYAPPEVDRIISEFPIAGVSITYTTAPVPDQDWNAAWEEQGFEPIVVDDTVTIYDAHHTPAGVVFPTPLSVAIQARNAFGTGTHETTRMVVSTLLSMPLQGLRMLDCGCGTGILAITALLRGAESAVGYDIDEWSADNARHNARLNGVGDRLEVLLGDSGVLSHTEGLFDLVVANINRNILLGDMPRFREVMSSGGWLVLSGFYTGDVPLLVDAASACGLRMVSRMEDNGWCCLKLRLA